MDSLESSIARITRIPNAARFSARSLSAVVARKMRMAWIRDADPSPNRGAGFRGICHMPSGTPCYRSHEGNCHRPAIPTGTREIDVMSEMAAQLKVISFDRKSQYHNRTEERSNIRESYQKRKVRATENACHGYESCRGHISRNLI
jgi:hypothetical protein